MNRKKKLFIISAGLILVGFSATAVNAATTTANNVDVALEQQENTTNDKIRYISTLELSNGVTITFRSKVTTMIRGGSYGDIIGFNMTLSPIDEPEVDLGLNGE